MTVLNLMDFSCHSMKVCGQIRYIIKHNKTGGVCEVMRDREKAKDLTRYLQLQSDKQRGLK